MSNRNSLMSGLALTLTLAIVGALTRKGAGRTWAALTGEAPPPERPKEQIHAAKAASWVLVSGALVGLARLAVRRQLGK